MFLIKKKKKMQFLNMLFEFLTAEEYEFTLVNTFDS